MREKDSKLRSTIKKIKIDKFLKELEEAETGERRNSSFASPAELRPLLLRSFPLSEDRWPRPHSFRHLVAESYIQDMVGQQNEDGAGEKE